MRRRLLYLLALSAPALILSGCSPREDPQPQSDFRPTATIKDIMVSIIDPESDVLWNSVATIVSLSGTEERARPGPTKSGRRFGAARFNWWKPRICCASPAVWLRGMEEFGEPPHRARARNDSTVDRRRPRNLVQAGQSVARCRCAGVEGDRRKERGRSLRRGGGHGAGPAKACHQQDPGIRRLTHQRRRRKRRRSTVNRQLPAPTQTLRARRRQRAAQSRATFE